jgi:hypothetical protein
MFVLHNSLDVAMKQSNNKIEEEKKMGANDSKWSKDTLI